MCVGVCGCCRGVSRVNTAVKKKKELRQDVDTNRIPSSCTPTDGHSMWASVQKEPPPPEPDYSSIEQLFCLPVTEHKDKGAAAPVKKESKEVCLVNNPHCSSEPWYRVINKTLCSFIILIDNIH